MTPLLRNYTKLAGTSEASEHLYLMTAYSAIATLLGRRVWLPFGDGKIYTNLYMLFIGDPGTRKSSAIKMGKKRVKAAGFVKFCGDKVTLQKLMCDMAGVDEDGKSAQVKGTTQLDDITLKSLGLSEVADDAYSEMYIIQDEFSDFIGVGNFGMVSTLGSWWDIDTHYEYRLKNSSSLLIPTPHINLLGGTTPGQFITMFPPQMADQGILSRMILVSARRTGRMISRPEANDPLALDAIDSQLAQLMHLQGPVEASPVVWSLLDNIYKTWKGVDDARFATYATRRHTQLLKFTMLTAASRMSTIILPEDVLMANTVLTYTERLMPEALGSFGKQEDSDVSHKIVELLRHASKPLTPLVIYPHVTRDIAFGDFSKLLTSMAQGQLIQRIEGQGFLATKKPIQMESDSHVNWSYLKGIAPDLLF